MSAAPQQAERRQRRWPFFLVFAVGLAVLAYPIVTRFYYDTGAAQVTAGFDTARSALSPEEVAHRVGMAVRTTTPSRPDASRTPTPRRRRRASPSTRACWSSTS